MSQDAALQLRRLLRLIPKLADGEPHALADVARMAHADPDTIIRDLHSLSERYGDPGGFVPGLNIYIEAGAVTMRTDHFFRPMRLTAPELCALELGLAMVRAERPPDEQAAIDRARSRLRKVLARLPATEARAAHDPAGDDFRDGMPRYAELAPRGGAMHLATLRAGVREKRKVRITYRSADAQESHTRVISPYGLIAASGAWYVAAHCDDRGAIRIFRLDRIESAALTRATFTVPSSFSLDSVMDNGKVFHAEEPESLRVRYSPRVARWIAEREGVALDADGSVTVEHPLADARWAVRHVLQYGPNAEVLSPAHVRQAVIERLRRIVGD
ncbi:MAG TPA: WYL domain-containing protein [Gemmatimonadaceae bacterium]|nr:WYL domain-containing protein [Gemmatimonadaceae bacterium]